MLVCREPVYDQPDTGYESYQSMTLDERNYGSHWSLYERTEGSGSFVENGQAYGTFLLVQAGSQTRSTYGSNDIFGGFQSRGQTDIEIGFADFFGVTTAFQNHEIEVGDIGWTGRSTNSGETLNSGTSVYFSSTASNTGSASACFVGPMPAYPWVFSEYPIATTSYIQGNITTDTTSSYSAIFGTYNNGRPTTYTGSSVCDTTTTISTPSTITTSTDNILSGIASTSVPPFSTTTYSTLCPVETTTTVTTHPGTTYNASRMTYLNWTELGRPAYRTVYYAQNDGVNNEWIWMLKPDMPEGVLLFTDAFSSGTLLVQEPVNPFVSVDEFSLFNREDTQDTVFTYMDVGTAEGNHSSWAATDDGMSNPYVPGYLPMDQTESTFSYNIQTNETYQSNFTSVGEVSSTVYGVSTGRTIASTSTDLQRIVTHRDPNGDPVVTIENYTDLSQTRGVAEGPLLNYGLYGSTDSTNDNTAPYDDQGYYSYTEYNSTVTFAHFELNTIYFESSFDSSVIAIIPAFTTGFQLPPDVDASDQVFRGVGAGGERIPYDLFLACMAGGDNGQLADGSVSIPLALAGSTRTIFHSIDERTWQFAWTSLPLISVSSFSKIGTSIESRSFSDFLFGVDPMDTAPFFQTGMDPFTGITLIGGRQAASRNDAKETVYLRGLLRATDNWSNTWIVSETGSPVSFLIETSSAVALSAPLQINLKTFLGTPFYPNVSTFQMHPV